MSTPFPGTLNPAETLDTDEAADLVAYLLLASGRTVVVTSTDEDVAALSRALAERLAWRPVDVTVRTASDCADEAPEADTLICLGGTTQVSRADLARLATRARRVIRFSGTDE